MINSLKALVKEENKRFHLTSHRILPRYIEYIVTTSANYFSFECFFLLKIEIKLC